MTTATAERTRIPFHFQPYQIDKHQFAVTKADEGGQNRRYVRGISSGSKIDQEGERMTEECIKSFMEQATSGQVFLYPDVHGIKQSEDIGKMVKAEVLPDGNWFTEYRLYDSGDGIGANKQEKIDDIWKQLNGEAPYDKPVEKGFSIEGMIPPDGIVDGKMDDAGNIVSNRVLNKIVLDGVCLVPRPAYQDSVAHAVYKALGELHPDKATHIRKGIQEVLRAQLQEEELSGAYHEKRWDVDAALQTVIEKIMKKKNAGDRRAELTLVFDEYREVMIDLLMRSEAVFTSEDDDSDEQDGVYSGGTPLVRSRRDILKELHAVIKDLSGLMKKPAKR